MAKSKSPLEQPPEASEAQAPAPPPAAPGPARVVPEFRGDGQGGPVVIATRMADYPAEAAAGYRRYKVHARLPFESTYPPAYVIAPDAEAAGAAYRERLGLLDLPGDAGKRLQTIARELPD